MLKIDNLHVKLAETGKNILNGINLEVKPGEVHAVMGPNGAGKSTLAQVLAGREGYDVTEGDIIFDGENIAEKEADERARSGIFLAFQYPVELPGVNTAQFLRTVVGAQRGKAPNAAEFLKQAKQVLDNLNMPHDFLQRFVNVGFSGGEKKRLEMVQMALLQPKLAVLDETDSGLDVDAMKLVAGTVNSLRSADRSFLMITHYERLLELIKPDVVHVLSGGRIVKSGGPELAKKIELEGYSWL
ncbi:MAG TPA: Fe-S cluster assembly ATPase SufC [Alphaproteobacteria bacterium]|nr:Fe-S cluster assembly ATPase SufC [Alphaproteobacteria bacterium]